MYNLLVETIKNGRDVNDFIEEERMIDDGMISERVAKRIYEAAQYVNADSQWLFIQNGERRDPMMYDRLSEHAAEIEAKYRYIFSLLDEAFNEYIQLANRIYEITEE